MTNPIIAFLAWFLLTIGVGSIILIILAIIRDKEFRSYFIVANITGLIFGSAMVFLALNLMNTAICR